MGKKTVEQEVIDQVYEIGKGEASKDVQAMKDNIQSVHDFAVKTGRVQAFRVMQLLAEFMEMKQMAQMVDSKDYLKVPGVKTLEDYFESQGISRRKGFDDVKIGRTLTADEVQLLCTVGFTRKDLLNYSSLPEDKRLEIREGKVINLETASREEIKDLIEQVVIETRQAKEEAEDTVKAAEKVARDKEKTINKQAKQLALYDRSAKQKELLPEEDAILGKIEELETSLHGYALSVENVYDALQANPFPAGVAAFITLMDNIKMRVSHFREVAVTELAPVGMLPEEEWVPPPLRDASQS